MSQRADLIRPPTSAPTASPSWPVVRRACACGRHNVAHAGNGGECAECRRKRLGLQRRAVGRGPDVAPPIVHEVLGAPGRPPARQSHGKSRFSHDFSQVRAQTVAAPTLQRAFRPWPFNGRVINRSHAPVTVWSDGDGLYTIAPDESSDRFSEDVDHVRDSRGQWYKVGVNTTTVYDSEVMNYACAVHNYGDACP